MNLFGEIVIQYEFQFKLFPGRSLAAMYPNSPVSAHATVFPCCGSLNKVSFLYLII